MLRKTTKNSSVGCRLTLLFSIGLLLQACQSQSGPVADRWYSHEQVTEGSALYNQHCAICHQTNGTGTPNWKQRDAAGNLPPPPLNGSAHTWHHSLALLDEIIREGGAPWQGSMPPFKDRLDAGQRRSVIAYLQSLWGDDIYQRWLELTGR